MKVLRPDVDTGLQLSVTHLKGLIMSVDIVL